MFEKKDIIFSETLGVCKVAEIVKLPAKNNDQVLYYGLHSIYDNKKVSYIPVEHHQVQLRPLISYEEAKQMENNLEKMSQQQQQEIAYVIQNHRE